MKAYLGPFTVTRNKVKLELPPHMRVHPVFHTISKLREYVKPDALFTNRAVPLPLSPACTIDGHEEYEVDSILDSRVWGRHKKRQFLIKWTDASEKDHSWEPEEFLQNCPEKLEKYRSDLSPDRPFGGKQSRCCIEQETLKEVHRKDARGRVYLGECLKCVMGLT
jgi:hypothetical protein